MAINRISIAFHIVRVLLVLLLAIIFIVSTIYFIRSIDAIGDDVDEARETHWGHTHEVEDTPLDQAEKSFTRSRHDPYDEYDGEKVDPDHHRGDDDDDREINLASPRGRLILGKRRTIYGVTESAQKRQHIISLIVWVVLTLFAAILSFIGIIGAFCIYPVLVLFSACMIAVHTIFSHVLPLFDVQLPSMTSNWFLLAIEAPTIILAIIFIALHRARLHRRAESQRKRHILY